MDYFEEQREEIESLKSIFSEEFAEISSSPPCFIVRIEDIPTPTPLQVKFTFPDSYPDEAPLIEIPNRSLGLPSDLLVELVQHLQQVAKESLGMAMVFTLINEAHDWLNSNAERITCQKSVTDDDNDVLDDVDDDESFADFRTSQSKQGGRWDYVIGLIGKPSAGKSTFFNAATQQNRARVASHPFTTIEPNIGRGFYAIPCPCGTLSKQCNAAYGHADNGDRYVPVILKDVAGLVPGACEGRGKGNKFMNDLLDADVLIHVIDASGETDENGKETSDYDPSQDVEWLYEELHRWIADNIMDKWDAICKKPMKLYDMFTGYHASKSLIQSIFMVAGITEKKLKNLFSLNKKDATELIDKLVSEFLKVRFPILLALNKIDRPDAEKNIAKFHTKFKGMSVVLVSAKSEMFLQQQDKDGLLQYAGGAADFSFPGNDVLSDGPISQVYMDTASEIRSKVLFPYGSTGVLKAVSEAVCLRQPVYAFPVNSLDTLESINVLPGNKERDILRDCVTLKPGTSVGKLFNIMCNPPVSLLAGDYVRAECVDGAGKKRVMHKDDMIDGTAQIIKIMSNKKASVSNKQRS